MPNRILREGINSSPRVDSLSDGAELLYRRLISVADDYGRFYASPGTLRGACWPLRPERVQEARVAEWLQECVDAGLLIIYGSGRFLQLSDFKQQIRSKSKFPDPDINCLANAAQLRSTTRARTPADTDTDTTPHTTTTSSSEYPLTIAEIRKHDAAVDDVFVRRLVQDTIQACLSSPQFPQEKLPAITDKVMAAVCRESYATGPTKHGTGLLLHRVPKIVISWGVEYLNGAKHG